MLICGNPLGTTASLERRNQIRDNRKNVKGKKLNPGQFKHMKRNKQKKYVRQTVYYTTTKEIVLQVYRSLIIFHPLATFVLCGSIPWLSVVFRVAKLTASKFVPTTNKAATLMYLYIILQ